MIQSIIKNLILNTLQELGLPQADFVVEHPGDLTHGDYSSNVAMVLSKKVGENPKALSEKIKIELEKNIPKEIAKVEIAGPGFINFYLSKRFFCR